MLDIEDPTIGCILKRHVYAIASNLEAAANELGGRSEATLNLFRTLDSAELNLQPKRRTGNEERPARQQRGGPFSGCACTISVEFTAPREPVDNDHCEQIDDAGRSKAQSNAAWELGPASSPG